MAKWSSREAFEEMKEQQLPDQSNSDLNFDLNFYPDLIKVGNNIVGSSEVEGKERKAKAE